MTTIDVVGTAPSLDETLDPAVLRVAAIVWGNRHDSAAVIEAVRRARVLGARLYVFDCCNYEHQVARGFAFGVDASLLLRIERDVDLLAHVPMDIPVTIELRVPASRLRGILTRCRPHQVVVASRERRILAASHPQLVRAIRSLGSELVVSGEARVARQLHDQA